jgi:hypothetical protein
MRLHTQQLLDLVDPQRRLLGRVLIEEIRGDLILGRFTEGPGYASLEHLFSAYREAVNQQLFSHVDELDDTIAALELRLLAPDAADVPAIYDVQIGSGRISFRLRPLDQDGHRAPDQGHSASAREPLPGPRAGP